MEGNNCTATICQQTWMHLRDQIVQSQCSVTANGLQQHGDLSRCHVFFHFWFHDDIAEEFAKHGQKAVNALFSEFCQLDDRVVFDPMHAKTPNARTKKAALWAKNFIKEKRSHILKGYTCTDRSLQRTVYTKEKTASLTVATDALMLSFLMLLKNVSCYCWCGRSIPPCRNVWSHVTETNWRNCQVNPRYSFIVQEGGKEVLYLKLYPFYGMSCFQILYKRWVLNSSLLYDPCIANKVIDGKQHSIVWYMNDNKISHMDAIVMTQTILENDHNDRKRNTLFLA